MTSNQNEDMEYYAYSSDEDGYVLSDEEGVDADEEEDPNMEEEHDSQQPHAAHWKDNPNAAPMAGSYTSTGSGSYMLAPHTPTKSGIRMLAAEQVRPEMQARIQDVGEVLNIPHAAATVLLRQYHWVKETLLEEYMTLPNPDPILEQAGIQARCHLHNNPPVQAMTPSSLKPAPYYTCEICYDDQVTIQDWMTMPCGHGFCLDCWHDFVVNAIQEEGPASVKTTCPQAHCPEIVTEVEIQQALQQNLTTTTHEKDPDRILYHKFLQYQLRSFVESNPLTRWCPGRGCERIACAPSALALEAEGAIAYCDACILYFCVHCGEEPHAPCHCKDLSLWNEKCRNESETANWILANTKSCPKCVSRIEKNQGCNHMTCQRCRHEFCWICMGDWHDHGANTGGYYKCNKFETTSGSSGGLDDAAQAKRDLDRYLHYYKRYHAHSEAQKFAKKQLKETEARMVMLQESSDDARWSDVEFLKTANEQLVECRRVLKYTYVFAFYMDSSPTNRQGMMHRERFEHHQEMLERFTENLSELSEKPLSEMDRTVVVNQTRVVDRFMKNILKYVEEGMEDL